MIDFDSFSMILVFYRCREAPALDSESLQKLLNLWALGESHGPTCSSSPNFHGEKLKTENGIVNFDYECHNCGKV